MKIIDSGPRARHRRGTASKCHYLATSAKFFIILKTWQFFWKKEILFFQDNLIMFMLKMIGIA